MTGHVTSSPAVRALTAAVDVLAAQQPADLPGPGGHCQGSGCSRGPDHRLIPHHADPWASCGTTSLTDTALLCEQTHHHLHHGHTITLKDGRHLGPHGWTTDAAA